MHPWNLIFEGTEAEARQVEATLEDAALSCSRFEKTGTAGQVWVLEVLLSVNPLASESDPLNSALSGFELTRFSCDPLPEKDWVAENRASFPPLEIGRFFIHASHQAPSCPPTKVALEVDASLAFGTGGHGTTRGCLELIETIAAEKPNSILDLGCGTGLLAMAAAHVFPDAQTIHASDNDEEAIQVTRHNLVQNRLGDRIFPVISEGFAAPVLQETPYDLILANILAGPLIELAPAMQAHTAPGGFIILSGLLREQSPSVIRVYADKGFKVQDDAPHEEWTALLLKKM